MTEILMQRFMTSKNYLISSAPPTPMAHSMGIYSRCARTIVYIVTSYIATHNSRVESEKKTFGGGGENRSVLCMLGDPGYYQSPQP